MPSLLRITSLLIILFSVHPWRVAHGAPTPGDTDLIRERQERLLDEQRRRLEDLKELPEEPIQPPGRSIPNDSRCFPVNSIELRGADQLSPAERERLLTPYTERCLGVSGKNQL